MTSAKTRCCIAVVSPFIDKRHGTERRVAEWTSRLGDEYEVHVYSQGVEDLDLNCIRWHRIPKLPGPHLLNFSWWFVANHLWRWWDRNVHGIRHELVFTPGTNCLDADVISIHIVFAEFTRQIRAELEWRRNPVRFWPRLLHRRLYYALIIALERRMYTNPQTQLMLIARKTADDLKRFYGIDRSLPVVYIGLDQKSFNPAKRAGMREQVRRQLGLDPGTCVLLLVGNDWRKKGLLTLLDVMREFRDQPVLLLVAGKDDPYPYQVRMGERGVREKVRFLPSRGDVEYYYAAADIYVGPSIEDTFAQPPAEAMACGLPVVTTVTNGTAEIMTHGVDGFIVQDPGDVKELTANIRPLVEDAALRARIGEKAAATARQYTWDRNGEQFREILAEVRGRTCAAATSD